MSKLLILLLVIGAGAAQPFQVAMNAKVEKLTESPLLSAVVSFAVGLVLLVVLWASGIAPRGSLGAMSGAPWWAWMSGLLGSFIVVAGLVALPKSSAALVVAGFVFGQGFASLAMDHFGWLEVKRIPINAWRIAGVLLMFLGVVLMQKR